MLVIVVILDKGLHHLCFGYLVPVCVVYVCVFVCQGGGPLLGPATHASSLSQLHHTLGQLPHTFATAS